MSLIGLLNTPFEPEWIDGRLVKLVKSIALSIITKPFDTEMVHAGPGIHC
jgi:hypothetical protein